MALESLSKAAELDPKQPAVWGALSETYLAFGGVATFRPSSPMVSPARCALSQPGISWSGGQGADITLAAIPPARKHALVLLFDDTIIHAPDRANIWTLRVRFHHRGHGP